jgi:hypothetical protein
MAAIKIHGYEGTNDGTVSCDFRGENAIGHAQGDEHRTLFEIDPATPDEIEFVLNEGPKINKMLARMVPADAMKAIEVLSGGRKAGVRLGLWDQ